MGQILVKLLKIFWLLLFKGVKIGFQIFIAFLLIVTLIKLIGLWYYWVIKDLNFDWYVG